MRSETTVQHDRSAQTIVAATDFSSDARVAVEHAARLAEDLRGQLRIVHVVVRGQDVGPAAMSADAEREVRHGRRDLDSVAAMTRSAHPKISVSYELDVGNPCDTLVHRSTDATILVMGARGHDSYPYRWGSTSENVSTRASCPVVVTRAENHNATMTRHHGAIVVEAATAEHTDDALRHAARVAASLAMMTRAELVEVLEAGGRRCDPDRLIQTAEDHDASMIVMAEPRFGSSSSVVVREVIERTDRPVVIVHDQDELVLQSP
jgi:nucleotide-binding universal stress UspA family protein